MSLLNINNLDVSVEDKKILTGLNLKINKGEVHVIMGPNGAGKSTLAASIVGNPKYTVTSGVIEFDNEDITELEVHERARMGIFLSFQNPHEVPGLRIEEFLRTAKESIIGKKLPIMKFHRELIALMKKLNIPKETASRSLNVGFSGGEKKKLEVLQLACLDPKFAILDETDSGLDIDATRIVFEGVSAIKREDTALLIITHHNKVLEYIKPDFVHILKNGRIVKTSGMDLVKYVEEHGYENIKED